MLFFYIIIFILGLAVGSFSNCLAERWGQDKSMKGRSCCPKCSHQLAWYDNIPLLSFCLLKRRCRYCRQPIAWQYFLVELIVGLLFVLAFYFSPWRFELYWQSALWPSALTLLRNWLLIGWLNIIFLMDLRYYVIVDKVSLTGAAMMLAFNLLLGFSWQNLALAGIIGAGFFLLQFIVSQGKWIGGGDIRLGLLMGLALGWPQVLVAMMLAYLLGAVCGVGLMLTGKKQLSSKLPFGTFLSVATIICLFFGQQLLIWYLGLYN